MKCLIARLLVLLVLLIPASTLFSPPDASAQTTWKLKEITYADINKKLDPNEAVGRGPDFIKWTPSASSFPPPETLRLGDTVSLSFEAAYQYGAGQGGADAGRPKRAWIEVVVFGQSERQSFDLVPNFCSWKVPPDLPPNMPKSGTLKVSKSVTLDDAFKNAETMALSAGVAFEIYCWEPEASGRSGFTAVYEKVDVPTALPSGAASPSASANAAPSVTLTANHSDLKYYEGDTVIMDADALDDKERPEELQYTWEAENLDTGAIRRKGPVTNWRRLTQEIAVKTPPRDKTTRYRFKVLAVDRQGAQGEASLEIELLKPDITRLELKNSAKNFVSEYWKNDLKVGRRGQFFGLDVHLENVNPKHHSLRLFIDGNRVREAEAGETDWVILKKGWEDPGKTYRLVVFVPPSVPVGEHKVDAAVIRKSDEVELDKEPLDPDLFVLFNPFSRTVRPDVSVRKANPIDDLLAYPYTLGAQDYYFYPGPSGIDPLPIVVTPYDPSVFEVARRFIMELPPSARADASMVAEYFVKKVFGEMLQGDWSGNYAGGIAPWHLAGRGAPFIARRFLDSGRVKFAQCFVYGQVVTALLRSVGIPARTLSNQGSGHDSRPPWGMLSNFFDRGGNSINVYEVWNFHVWNEAWIPSVSSGGGWVLLDATGQQRASDSGADWVVAVPARDAVPSVAELPKGRQYPDGRDDVFVFTECNLPAYNVFLDCDAPCRPIDPSRILSSVLLSRRSAWAAYVDVQGTMVDVIAAYRPRGTAAPSFDSAALSPIPFISLPAPSERRVVGAGPGGVLFGPGGRAAGPPPINGIRVDIPDKHELLKPLRGRIEISGIPSDAPARLMIMLEYLPRDFNVGAGGAESVASPVKHFQNVDIRPAGGNWEGEFFLPAEAFDIAGAYKLSVGLHDIELEGRVLRIHVQGMPLSLDVPAVARRGESIPIRASLRNASGSPLRGVRLALALPPSWKTAAGAETEIVSRDLGPDEVLVLAVEAVPETAGKFRIHAEAETPAGPTLASAAVNVSGPPEIVLDALPVAGVGVGSAVEIEVAVMNDGAEPLSGLEIRLAAVDGVEIVGSETKSVPTVPDKGRQIVSWNVKPSRNGVFQLPVTALGPGGASAVETVIVTAGSDDPDDFSPEVPAGPSGAGSAVVPPLPSGAGEGDLAAGPDISGSGAFDDFVSAAGAVSSAGQEMPPGSLPGGAAGAGGPSAGGGGPVVPGGGGISPVLIAIGILIAGILVLAVLLVLRIKSGRPDSQTAGFKADVCIEVIGSGGAAKTVHFRRVPITVGRAPGNDLVFDDPEASRRHFEIRVEAGRLTVVDLGSSSGTIVDGRKVSQAPGLTPINGADIL